MIEYNQIIYSCLYDDIKRSKARLLWQYIWIWTSLLDYFNSSSLRVKLKWTERGLSFLLFFWFFLVNLSKSVSEAVHVGGLTTPAGLSVVACVVDRVSSDCSGNTGMAGSGIFTNHFAHSEEISGPVWTPPTPTHFLLTSFLRNVENTLMKCELNHTQVWTSRK